MVVPFCISTIKGWKFLLLHILSSIWCQCFCGHNNDYIVIAHCCFNLQFFNDLWFWASFCVFICHLFIFFHVVVRSLIHFWIELYCFLLLSFKSSLYNSNNNLLSDMSFANIFSSLWFDFSFFWQCLLKSRILKS